MNIGKRQGEFTVAAPLIQADEETFHPEVSGLAEIGKTGFSAPETFRAGHVANDLLNPPALIFSQNLTSTLSQKTARRENNHLANIT